MSKIPFQRYLLAKKSVDDRALNQAVWERLVQELGGLPKNRGELSVLEVGAGVGTMLQRMVSKGLLTKAVYHGIDPDPESISFAQTFLTQWVKEQGLRLDSLENGYRLSSPESPELEIKVSFADQDLAAMADTGAWQGPWDLVVAHAVLDLLDVNRALLAILRLSQPGTLLYFTINYDGLTIFEPEIDRQTDGLILDLYNRSMDERVTQGQLSGDSRTGRHLFRHLMAMGLNVLESGSSDWVVFPRQGRYLQEEALFLHAIVDTVDQALRNSPELDVRMLDAWIAKRHQQIDAGTLVYIAHQMDFLSRVP